MLRTWTRWIAYPIILVAVMLLASCVQGFASGRSGGADDPLNQFTIRSFVADYRLEIQPDGTTDVVVTEQIDANFSRSRVNRGITRAIPLTYQDHTNSVTDITVTGTVRSARTTIGGAEVDTGTQPVSTTVDKNVLIIRIGNPDRYLMSGDQSWTLSYRLGDVAMNTPDGLRQEIYLDANGTGWEVPFTKVTARLHVPADLAGRLDGQTACYWGPEGARNTCPITTAAGADDTVITASAGPLDRRENLTFAVGFANDAFPVAYTPKSAALPWWLLVLPVIGLLAYAIALAQWFRATRGRRPGAIVTEYLPPEGVPALVAADVMGRAPRGPSAQLLEFVVAGTLTLRSTQPAEPGPDGPPSRLGWWQRRKLRKQLFIPTEDFEQIENADLQTIMKGYFGGGLGVAPHPDTAAWMADKQAELVQQGGWRTWASGSRTWLLPVFILFALLAGAGMLLLAPEGPERWLAYASAVLGLLLVIAAYFRQPSFGPLTEKGRDLRTHLLGLKQFMAMADSDRIAWLQGVESAPRVSSDDHAALVKLYEPLLPYAVILGHEKTWSELLGEHEKALPEQSAWLSDLRLNVAFADLVTTLDHGHQHRSFYSYSGSESMRQTHMSLGDSVSDATASFSEALSNMQRSDNDGGGGSSWSSSSRSSGGSSGGGRSGGGMGGGGGGGW
ncbi:DUF2207 domain-containing protein [Ammonicoccus fulvus]|uniref:DUF2207 domain-containing protein n=1 Tax=Ammonicoccus fulvus TaxID=3138240 RepID=A0ABZ3FSV2_9ACTN